MKRVFKFVLVALTAAAVVVACQKPPQEEQKPDEEQQKPGDEYTGPVQGTSAWSVIGAFLDSDWKKDYVCAEKDGAIVLKNVKLAKDNQIKFRKDKGWDENRGINEPDKAAELAAGTPTKAVPGGGNIIIPADGIYDLYYFAEKEAIVYVAKDAALPEIPDFTEPETPEGLVMDGDASDWAALNPANVVNIELPADAELNWIKNAKVYYDDKLYVLLELSDEAIAYSKTRFYLFFDTAALGNLTQHWAKSTIDYMTEGKIIVSGAPVDYSASLYAHNAELGGWNWTETGVAPTFDCKGAGNLYEFSMAYDNFPGTLPEAFNLGLQVADSDYATTGFLPQAEKMARIVKVGATDPGEGGEEDTWDYTPSAEYLAEDNLWKAVDANHTIESFYNPNWAGEKTAPELAFKESTYKVTLPDACSNDWNAQYWIRPTEQLVLDPAKKYSLKFTVNASTGGQFYVKLYQKGVDGAWSTETNPRVELTANESYEIKLDDFSPITTPQDLLIDFSHHEANTTFYIKDIILKVTGEVPPVDAKVLKLTKDMFPSAYPTEETVMTIPTGEKFYLLNVAHYLDYGNDIQIKKNGGYIANRTSFGKIKSIKVTCQADKTWFPTNLALYAGSAEKPADNAITATSNDNSSTYDLSAGDYQYFNLVNTSGYAVYLSEIVITYTGDAVTPSDPAPTGIKIDGDFSDWAAVEGKTTANDRITTWKAYSDADNLYIYYEITASKIKTKTANFDWEPYIYIGIDTDNNTATGEACGGGTSIAGCEVQVCTFPWRGETEGDGSADVVFDPSKHTFVNGSDANGWIKRPVSGSSVGNPVIYGKIDGSKCYIELSIARSLLGSPTGKISIESAMSWYPTGAGEVTLK